MSYLKQISQLRDESNLPADELIYAARSIVRNLLNLGRTNPIESPSDYIYTSGSKSLVFATQTSGTTAQAAPVGSPGAFNRVHFDLQSTDPSQFVQSLRVIVLDSTGSGTPLADVFLPVLVPYGETQTISVDVGKVITGAGWIEVYADGPIALRRLPTILYSSPVARYRTGANRIYTGGGATNFSPNINLWFGFSLDPGGPKPLDVSGTVGTSVPYATGTFSAWAGPIGIRTNFDELCFICLPFDGFALPTQFRIRLLDTDHNGSVLFNKTIRISRPLVANVARPIFVPLNDVFINSGQKSLWFEAYGSGRWGFAQMSSIVYPTPTYHILRYGQDAGIVGEPPTMVDSSSNNNIFVQTRRSDLRQRSTSPGDLLYNIFTQATLDLARPILSISSMMYGIAGLENNIYFENILRSPHPIDQYEITVTCNDGVNDIGLQDDLRWTANPSTSAVGDRNWQCDIYYARRLIASKSTILRIRSTNLGSPVTRKVLAIGDSLTEALFSSGGGYGVSEMVNLANGTSYTDLVVNGSDNTKCSSVSHPFGQWSIGKTLHITGGTGWTVQDTIIIAVSSGLATCSSALGVLGSTGGLANTSTGLTLTPIGTKTGTSVDSDANSRTIKHEGIGGWTFSKFYSDPTSPFVFSSVFNFATYLTTNSLTMTSGDYVRFDLGINEALSNKTDATLATALATSKTALDAMITNIKAAVSGVRIGIALPSLPSISQSAFGENYGNSNPQWSYKDRIQRVREWLLGWYDAGQQSNVTVYDVGVGVDTRNNMQTITRQVNAYQTALTRLVEINGVHPDIPGQYQRGKSEYCWIRGQEVA